MLSTELTLSLDNWQDCAVFVRSNHNTGRLITSACKDLPLISEKSTAAINGGERDYLLRSATESTARACELQKKENIIIPVSSKHININSVLQNRMMSC